MTDEFSEQIAHTAAKAVATFEDGASGALDFSEGSLCVVEEILAEASAHIHEMNDGAVNGLIQLLGCYLLEVGRREFKGRYLWHDSRDQPVLVVGEPNFRVAMLSFDKIRGRLSGDEGDNIPFFYRGFAERARTADPGTGALYV